jgi:MFS transporter, SET family, sugar efflux transporter
MPLHSASPQVPATSAPSGRVKGGTALAAAVGLFGLINALQTTTLSLFLADAVHAGPLLIGLFFGMRAAASITASQAAGRLSDRLSRRRLVMLPASLAGVIAGVALAMIRNYPAVLLTGVVLLSASGVSFGQLFAYAREHATARARDATGFTSVLRAVFSGAWAGGPAAGLLVVAHYGFTPLYLSTAVLSLALAALSWWGLPDLRARRTAGPAAHPAAHGSTWRLPPRLWLLLAIVVAFGVVSQMYGIDLALYVTQDLHQGPEVVGWTGGVAAALEIPVMIAAGKVADRAGKLRLTGIAVIAAAGYFCALPLVSSPEELIALQILAALWSGLSLSIPMVMVQDQAPGGAGTSSALYSSAFMASATLGSAITGLTAAAVGYRNVLWVCAIISAFISIPVLALRRRSGDAAVKTYR